jgi:murein DD-endopeptidase MepM/ murein hydrolase activator NlpD
MVIPGKYGSLKSLQIPRWIISSSILIVLSFFISLSIFIHNYVNLKKESQKNLDNIESLQSVRDIQNQELNNYKVIEDELKVRLEELKKLETQLKGRLDSSTEVETKAVAMASSLDEGVSIEELDNKIQSLYSLIESTDKKAAAERKIPNRLPYIGRITSDYGSRPNPIRSRGRSEFHHGIDIAGPYRSKIAAAADGIVEYAGWMASYGNAIIINHQNGYTTLYGHNTKLLVKKGQKVTRGQVISLMGSTGRSTGTHVHFEVRFNGTSVNPLKITKGV